MPSKDFLRQMEGYGITTANILYRLPDHPAIIQSFIWQQYDLQPEFPELRKFLNFWSEKIEGAIYRVIVGHSGLIKPAELRIVQAEFRLH
jgi:uncharacterized protein Usg